MIKLVNSRGTTLELPVTIAWRRIPLTITVPTVANARGDGAIVVGRSRREPRQFTLSGSIYNQDRSMIRTVADNLLALLQHPPIEVYKWPDRFLLAWPQGASQDWIDAGAELGIDIPMLAPDPFWYGAEVTEIEEDAESWSVEVGGTAPALPSVRVVVQSSGSNMTLLNAENGLYIYVDGPFQSGDVVTVNTATFEATIVRGGLETPIIDRLGDEYIAHGFELIPGANGLQYTGPAADVTITYRPRWY